MVRGGSDSSFSSLRSNFSNRSTTARGRVRRKSSGWGDDKWTGPLVWISDFAGAGVLIVLDLDAKLVTAGPISLVGVGVCDGVGNAGPESEGTSGRLAVQSEREKRCCCAPMPRMMPSMTVTRAEM